MMSQLDCCDVIRQVCVTVRVHCGQNQTKCDEASVVIELFILWFDPRRFLCNFFNIEIKVPALFYRNSFYLTEFTVTVCGTELFTIKH